MMLRSLTSRRSIAGRQVVCIQMLHRGMATSQKSSADDVVSFGGIDIRNTKSGTEVVANSMSWDMVRRCFPFSADETEVEFHPVVVNHLRWIAQKDAMGQDILLLGDASDFRRELVMLYCKLTNRNFEHVMIHPETSESDFKQRRDIVNKETVFLDMPAVRAAVQGDILLLEGLEKAERNVLPVLNNLLENREMNLEDGRMLVSWPNYQKMLKEGGTEEGLKRMGIVPVNPSFRAVALALPSAKYRGNPLDPPLRSRFQARICSNFAAVDSHLLGEKGVEMSRLVKTVSECHHQLSDNMFTGSGFPLDISERAVTSIGEFIHANPEASNAEILDFVKRVYPYQLFFPAEHRKLIDSIFTSFDGVKKGGKSFPSFSIVNGRLIEKQNELLTNILVDLKQGRDVCLISEKPAGKSAIANACESTLGQKANSMMLYNDMSPRDLLQTRRTNEHGVISWVFSPLVEAALKGELILLDHIHRVPAETLATLQPLIHNRVMNFPDGTRFISEEAFQEMLPEGESRASFTERTRIYPIHPDFRVIATAELPKLGDGGLGSVRSFLSPEVASMFSFHEIPCPQGTDLKEIMLNVTKSQAEEPAVVNAIESLVKLHEAFEANPSLGVHLTLHHLVRISRTVASGNLQEGDLFEIVYRSLLMELCPPSTRKEATDLMERCGIRDTKRKRAIGTEKKRKRSIFGTQSQVAVETPSAVDDDDDLLKEPADSELALIEDSHMIPRPKYFANKGHQEILKFLIRDFQSGSHLFLIGNQGTGKNVLTDRLLYLLKKQRQYMQLHRDTTVSSISSIPSIIDGQLVYQDSPLVIAAKRGHVAVVDEADKANSEVVTVLRSLIEGEMHLPDGRILLSEERYERMKETQNGHEFVKIHPDFRMIILSNRAGYPFHGNDLMREAELFATHVVSNPDKESELQLLRSYAPNVDEDVLRRLSLAFCELREMADNNLLTYPYSTREAIAVARHLNAYPDDSIATALENVLAPDAFEPQVFESILRAFRSHGFPLPKTYLQESKLGASHMAVRKSGNKISFKKATKRPPPTSMPKHGKVDPDNKPHVGGNTWAGGTGGSDTAGLGGRGGPYRLDVGQKEVHRLSDEEKAQVSEEARQRAREMAEAALDERLKEIDMNKREFSIYESYYKDVESDIGRLKQLFKSLEAKEQSRRWNRKQQHGELDEQRLVEAMIGEKDVFKRQMKQNPNKNFNQKLPKRVTFVVDCSGSMYSFNYVDQRLERELALLVMLQEALHGQNKIDYSFVGHSGDTYNIPLVDFNDPPKDAKERFKVLEKVAAHSQYCMSGDNTMRAIRHCVEETAKEEADEHIVIAITDANFERYGITPTDLKRLAQIDPKVNVRIVMIGSLWGEAEAVTREIPGIAYPVMSTDDLPSVLRTILTKTILK